jgi:hypothetical protein
VIRRKHYSFRTEQTYLDWIRRFILFQEKRHPADMGENEITSFSVILRETARSGARGFR